MLREVFFAKLFDWRPRSRMAFIFFAMASIAVLKGERTTDGKGYVIERWKRAWMPHNEIQAAESRGTSTRNILQEVGISMSTKVPSREERERLRNVLGVILNSDVDVNENVDNSGLVPLLLAAFGGLPQIAKRLIDKGASINAREENTGHTALTLAARGGFFEVARHLVAAGVDLDAKTKAGSSALWWASFRGFPRIANLLIENGADVKDVNRTSPLLIATQEGHTEIVTMLLEAGADPNPRSSRGFSPLVLAVQYTEKNEFVRGELRKALVDAGADPNFEKPGSKQTVVWVAAYLRDWEAVEDLIEYGSDVDRAASDGTSPLFVSVARNCTRCAESILEGGANPDPRIPVTLWTPLHAAASTGNLPSVENLLKAGADRNLKDWRNRAPIDVVGMSRKISPSLEHDIVALLRGVAPIPVVEIEPIAVPPDDVLTTNATTEGIETSGPVPGWAIYRDPEDSIASILLPEEEDDGDNALVASGVTRDWLIAMFSMIGLFVILQVICVRTYKMQERGSEGSGRFSMPRYEYRTIRSTSLGSSMMSVAEGEEGTFVVHVHSSSDDSE